MTPLELVRRAARVPLVDEDGEAVRLALAPGLSAEELAAFAATLPCALPDDVRELLRVCRGFDGVLEQVDFTGRDIEFEERTRFPHGLPIAADGFGNFWVVALTPDSRVFGPIDFACHDAPVLLHQSPDLAHFLAELFRSVTPPHASAIDDVHEDRRFEV